MQSQSHGPEVDGEPSLENIHAHNKPLLDPSPGGESRHKLTSRSTTILPGNSNSSCGRSSVSTRMDRPAETDERAQQLGAAAHSGQLLNSCRYTCTAAFRDSLTMSISSVQVACATSVAADRRADRGRAGRAAAAGGVTGC
jgi:hypothetical protein